MECKVLGLLSCLHVYIKALAASRAVSTGPISALPTRPGLSQKRGADTDAIGTPMQLGEVFFGPTMNPIPPWLLLYMSAT